MMYIYIYISNSYAMRFFSHFSIPLMNYGTVSCSTGTIAFAAKNGSTNAANITASVGGIIAFTGNHLNQVLHHSMVPHACPNLFEGTCLLIFLIIIIIIMKPPIQMAPLLLHRMASFQAVVHLVSRVLRLTCMAPMMSMARP